MLGCALLCIVTVGCAEPFPFDALAIREDCHPLTQDEIPPYPDDPHAGYKSVYACGVAPEALGELPYPDGTLIVKFSRRSAHQHAYLVATADKQEGVWRWAEYTRNFEDEPFLKLAISEQVCVACHQSVSGTLDWIFTPPGGH